MNGAKFYAKTFKWRPVDENFKRPAIADFIFGESINFDTVESPKI